MKRWRRLLRKLHADDRATAATEYMLLLATIVLPLALLVPTWMSMVRYYTARLINGIVLPFP